MALATMLASVLALAGIGARGAQAWTMAVDAEASGGAQASLTLVGAELSVHQGGDRSWTMTSYVGDSPWSTLNVTVEVQDVYSVLVYADEGVEFFPVSELIEEASKGMFGPDYNVNRTECDEIASLFTEGRDNAGVCCFYDGYANKTHPAYVRRLVNGTETYNHRLFTAYKTHFSLSVTVSGEGLANATVTKDVVLEGGNVAWTGNTSSSSDAFMSVSAKVSDTNHTHVASGHRLVTNATTTMLIPEDYFGDEINKLGLTYTTFNAKKNDTLCGTNYDNRPAAGKNMQVAGGALGNQMDAFQANRLYGLPAECLFHPTVDGTSTSAAIFCGFNGTLFMNVTLYNTSQWLTTVAPTPAPTTVAPTPAPPTLAPTPAPTKAAPKPAPTLPPGVETSLVPPTPAPPSVDLAASLQGLTLSEFIAPEMGLAVAFEELVGKAIGAASVSVTCACPESCATQIGVDLGGVACGLNTSDGGHARRTLGESARPLEVRFTAVFASEADQLAAEALLDDPSVYDRYEGHVFNTTGVEVEARTVALDPNDSSLRYSSASAVERSNAGFLNDIQSPAVLAGILLSATVAVCFALRAFCYGGTQLAESPVDLMEGDRGEEAKRDCEEVEGVLAETKGGGKGPLSFIPRIYKKLRGAGDRDDAACENPSPSLLPSGAAPELVTVEVDARLISEEKSAGGSEPLPTG